MRIVDEYVALRALVGDWPAEIPPDLLGLTYTRHWRFALRDGGPDRWADHDWPDSRLRSVDTELAELGQFGLHIGGTTRDRGFSGRSLGREPAWLDRLAETARPSLPGPDHGIDLGL